MKTYQGRRLVPEDKTVSEVEVVVLHQTGVRDLDPRPSQRIYNHSPTGFSWGYHGSGPAQLALAIMLDHTGSANVAILMYQRFKAKYVANWGDEWSVTANELDRFITAARAEDKSSASRR